MAPILFNLMELVIHGGVATSAMKAPYNPGLATSLVWLILSVWYIIEIYHQHLVTGIDWWIAIGYLIAWTVIALPVGTFILLSDRDSPTPSPAKNCPASRSTGGSSTPPSTRNEQTAIRQEEQ